MNREVKFKIWDKDAEVFLRPENIIIRADGHFFNRETEEELHNIESLQHTGLKDKNETELYGGDFCSCKYVCTVCFENKPHIITGYIVQDEGGEWMLDFGHGSMSLIELLREENSVERIDNIYENKELLK